MFSFKTRSDTGYLCAVVPDEEGIAVACIDHGDGPKPRLEQCDFHPFDPGRDSAAVMKKAVAQHRLDRGSCTTLLAGEDYQLLMVEAPEVPPAELRAAVRWRVRDLIDFHIDDAVLDIFDAPPSGARNVQQHIYVVVSRTALVEQRAALLQDAGARLDVIDIPELALRNIAARLPQAGGGRAMLYFDNRRGLITLTVETTLYLARSIEFGWRQLADTPELIERLALELQRSLDYYDRHFQQAPITRLSLCPSAEGPVELAGQLAQQTGIEVDDVRLENIVELPPGRDTAGLARCTLAIGAALRHEPARL